MGGEGTAKQRHIEMPLPAEMALGAQRMWKLPLALYTSWWSAGVEAWWPPMPRPHRALRHEEHDQSVVPEPFELSGEVGLFA
jgi:hypothetical protein